MLLIPSFICWLTLRGMDFSAFSNPSFDSVKWIDSMIAERPEDEQLDSFITSLTMKLHVVSQEYTDQLEIGRYNDIFL